MGRVLRAILTEASRQVMCARWANIARVARSPRNYAGRGRFNQPRARPRIKRACSCMRGGGHWPALSLNDYSFALGLCRRRCRAGFMCPSAGLAAATVRCAPGYFCPLGSAASNLTCPVGSECPSGSPSPSPCRAGHYQVCAGSGRAAAMTPTVVRAQSGRTDTSSVYRVPGESVLCTRKRDGRAMPTRIVLPPQHSGSRHILVSTGNLL